MLIFTSTVFAVLLGFAYSSPVPVSTENEINYELLGNHWWGTRDGAIDTRFLLGGGFEGDMILSGKFPISTGSEGRGVAIYGPRQWPSNTIPYDISAITGKTRLPKYEHWSFVGPLRSRCRSSNDDWNRHAHLRECHQYTHPIRHRLQCFCTLHVFRMHWRHSSLSLI